MQNYWLPNQENPTHSKQSPHRLEMVKNGSETAPQFWNFETRPLHIMGETQIIGIYYQKLRIEVGFDMTIDLTWNSIRVGTYLFQKKSGRNSPRLSYISNISMHEKFERWTKVNQVLWWSRPLLKIVYFPIWMSVSVFLFHMLYLAQWNIPSH